MMLTGVRKEALQRHRITSLFVKLKSNATQQRVVGISLEKSSLDTTKIHEIERGASHNEQCIGRGRV